MNPVEKILKAHPFFRGIKPNHLAVIAERASSIHFKKGKYIFKEGESANAFYVIMDGKVVLESYVPGKGAIQILTINSGDVLGWSWLYPPYKWHFDAKALEETHCITLDGKHLRQKCDENVELGYELMKRFTQIIIGRLHSARLQLLNAYK